MSRKNCDNRILAFRRKAIEEELAELQRAQKRMERETAPERGAPFYLTRAAPQTPAEPEPTVPQDTIVQAPSDNLPAAETPVVSATPPPVIFQQPPQEPEKAGGAGPAIRNDPKFASYFITGGLHGPPLSVEYKKTRNRAIILSIVAIVIIVFVVRMLFF